MIVLLDIQIKLYYSLKALTPVSILLSLQHLVGVASIECIPCIGTRGFPEMFTDGEKSSAISASLGFVN